MQLLQEALQQIGRLFVWLIVVAPWEQALRVRLGSRVRLLSAGWYVTIPFVDRVYRQSVRRRLSIVAPQALTTRDGQSITVGGAVGYAIKDLRRLYDSLHDADDTIDSTVGALVAEFVASHDRGDCGPSHIEAHVRDHLDLEKYGLDAQEYYVTNYVATKTLRIVTGEIRGYPRGSLNTTVSDGQRS